QRRERVGCSRGGARPRRDPRRAAERADRLPALVGAVARTAEPVPARDADRRRRLRPQRGGRGPHPPRGRGDRPRARAPGRGGRPDDALRGIGRIAGSRAQRVAIKETLKYLRGRSRESVVGEILAGIRSAGRSTADVTVYESETAALNGELARTDGAGRPDGP